MSKYGVFSGPYFPAFGLNTDQKKLRIWKLCAEYYPSKDIHKQLQFQSI